MSWGDRSLAARNTAATIIATPIGFVLLYDGGDIKLFALMWATLWGGILGLKRLIYNIPSDVDDTEFDIIADTAGLAIGAPAAFLLSLSRPGIEDAPFALFFTVPAGYGAVVLFFWLIKSLLSLFGLEDLEDALKPGKLGRRIVGSLMGVLWLAGLGMLLKWLGIPGIEFLEDIGLPAIVGTLAMAVVSTVWFFFGS